MPQKEWRGRPLTADLRWIMRFDGEIFFVFRGKDNIQAHRRTLRLQWANEETL